MQRWQRGQGYERGEGMERDMPTEGENAIGRKDWRFLLHRGRRAESVRISIWHKRPALRAGVAEIQSGAQVVQGAFRRNVIPRRETGVYAGLLYGASHSWTVALRRERRSRFDSDTPRHGQTLKKGEKILNHSCLIGEALIASGNCGLRYGKFLTAGKDRQYVDVVQR